MLHDRDRPALLDGRRRRHVRRMESVRGEIEYHSRMHRARRAVDAHGTRRRAEAAQVLVHPLDNATSDHRYVVHQLLFLIVQLKF
jgi:hypothetical protein